MSDTVSPRMRAILEAGVRVLGSQGLRGLTHRAVDAEAGLPPGSCSAYLRTRSALLVAVAEHVAGRLTDDIEALADRLAERPGDTVHDRGLTTRLFLDWLEDRDLLVARIELTLESSRRPELASEFEAWRRQLEEVVQHAITRAGRGRSIEHAQAVTAALEGVLLRALVTAEPGRQAYVEQTIEILLSALASAPDGDG